MNKRGVMKKRIIIGMLLLISTKSEAFTFDVWKSGMDADTVIMTAMKEEFPLAAAGKYAFENKFSKQACVPYRKSATKYSYNVELLGKRAHITLFMTEKEKRLMKINIRWNNARELKKIIERIINSKEPLSKRKGEKTFGHPTIYKIDNRTEIAFKYQMGFINLTYSDIELIRRDTINRQKNKEKTLVKDVSKDWKKF
jgi:hypothetical protein